MLAVLLELPQGTFASEVEIGDGSIQVTREIDGGLQTFSLTMAAIVTTDSRLNEPRYASLPNIMKAKKKPLETISAEELGVDLSPRQNTLKVSPPPERAAGIVVESIDQLVDKLKNEAKVIKKVYTLVVAEHDNQELKGATLNTVAAANAIGGDIDILVAGSNCGNVAEAASQVPGISKVLAADQETYKNSLAENLGNLVVELSEGYSHILAPATTNGKNFMPRVAAKLDASKIDIIVL